LHFVTVTNVLSAARRLETQRQPADATTLVAHGVPHAMTTARRSLDDGRSHPPTRHRTPRGAAARDARGRVTSDAVLHMTASKADTSGTLTADQVGEMMHGRKRKRG